MSTNQMVRQLGDAAVRGCCALLEHWAPATPDSCAAILGFHRVGDFPGRPTWNVGTRQFEQLLRGMLERGFTPCTLDQLVRGGLAGQGQRFAVTFDDGYASILANALPILRRLEIPATVFLVTGAIGQDQPFVFDDWDHRGKSGAYEEAWRPLNIAECQELADSGLIEFGSHTHSHADFRTSPQLLARDLNESKAWLRQNLGCGESIPFAFPYGNKHLGFCDDLSVQIVREAGMACALTTDPTLITGSTDPFSMGRYLVHPEDRLASVYNRMNGWHPYVKNWIRNCVPPISRRSSFRFGKLPVGETAADVVPDGPPASVKENAMPAKCSPG